MWRPAPYIGMGGFISNESVVWRLKNVRGVGDRGEKGLLGSVTEKFTEVLPKEFRSKGE